MKYKNRATFFSTSTAFLIFVSCNVSSGLSSSTRNRNVALDKRKFSYHSWSENSFNASWNQAPVLGSYHILCLQPRDQKLLRHLPAPCWGITRPSRWLPCRYPGYQRFFSRAAGIFGVGRSHERVTIKTSQKPETALEKSLAPRVPCRVSRTKTCSFRIILRV